MVLTKRELEIVKLIGKEYTSEQIATELHVSLATIETHRHNLFRKAGVQSVVGLIKKAIHEGWINIDATPP